MNKTNCLIIAGMHRSGTSLTTNLLFESGLFVGEQLMSNGFDNVKGHFEDLEAVKIHEHDLKAKGLDSRGLHKNIPRNLSFENSSKTSILEFIEKRKHLSLWGFKDPRTTLYMEAWKKVIPNSKFIAIYRHYEEVEYSLLKRYKYKLKNGVGMSKMARAKHRILYPLVIKRQIEEARSSWLNYNKNIVDFSSVYPDSIVVFELSHFLRKYNEILSIINSKFEINLKSIDTSKIFEPDLMSSKDDFRSHRTTSKKNNKELENTLNKLKEMSTWIQE